MKLLAIIPARSGSKRVPGKNIKQLGGLPLIAHTILAAKNSGYCDTIVVSTDCQQIADVALEYQAVVPWLRSAELASDTANVVDAIIEVITRFKQQDICFDSVLLLQPTSPFRTAASIKKAVELHKQTGLSVVSVNQPTIKPSWFKFVDNANNLIAYNQANEPAYPLYQLNGSIYLVSVEHLKHQRTLYSEPTKALILENLEETIDIDTPLDWALAEKLIEQQA